MKHICITGGIGSGKSFICKILKDKGIEIYDCDAGAKRLMNESDALRKQLCELIGNDAYKEGRLNKPVVAQFLLTSESNKQAINAIVHPAVMEDFIMSGMQWMECAILYEANLERFADIVIAVIAPEEVRTERIMKRDALTREKAKEWIDKQFPQEEVRKKADFVIINDGITPLEPQLDRILDAINKL